MTITIASRVSIAGSISGINAAPLKNYRSIGYCHLRLGSCCREIPGYGCRVIYNPFKVVHRVDYLYNNTTWQINSQLNPLVANTCIRNQSGPEIGGSDRSKRCTPTHGPFKAVCSPATYYKLLKQDCPASTVFGVTTQPKQTVISWQYAMIIGPSSWRCRSSLHTLRNPDDHRRGP